MSRPYLAPKDGGGSDHAVDREQGRKRTFSRSAPWEQDAPRRLWGQPTQSSPPSDPPTPSRPTPHTRAAPRQAPPPARQAPPSPRVTSTGLALTPDASATSFSKEEAESFWALPSIEPLQGRAPSDSESLSGPAEDFDDSTGWLFPAVDLPDLEPRYDLTNEQRNAPILPSSEELFCGAVPALPADVSTTPRTPAGLHIPNAPPAPRSSSPPPLSTPPRSGSPPPPPRSSSPPPPPRNAAPLRSPAGGVDELLARGRELLNGGDLGGAINLLRAAQRIDRGNNSVRTSLELAERHLLREHLPDATPASVPRLTQDPSHLMRQAQGNEKQVVGALDGHRTLGELLSKTNANAYVPMLRVLASFVNRGWVNLD